MRDLLRSVSFVSVAFVALQLVGCSGSSDTHEAERGDSKYEEVFSNPIGIKVEGPGEVSPQLQYDGGDDDGGYYWVYNLELSANKDLRIIEYGSFVNPSGTWIFRTRDMNPYSETEFCEDFGLDDPVIEANKIYKSVEFFEWSNAISTMNLMYYVIGVDEEQNKFIGYTKFKHLRPE